MKIIASGIFRPGWLQTVDRVCSSLKLFVNAERFNEKSFLERR